MKKIIGAIAGVAAAIIIISCMLITSVVGAMFGGKDDSGQTDLLEIIVNHHKITNEFKGEDYDDWLPDARAEVYEMRQKKCFAAEDGDSDEDIAKKENAEVMAISTLFVYWIDENTSIVPEDFDIDWEKYCDCFTGEDFTADGYDATADESFDKVEEYFGIKLGSSIRSTIGDSALEIKGRVSTESMLDGYDENTCLKSGTTECEDLWKRIKSDHDEHPNVLSSGNWAAPDPDWKQCTSFASWRLWVSNGKKHGTAGGNGCEVAKKLVVAYPGEFELSNEPKAGAIFSVMGGAGGTSSAGHVGYVEAVDDKYIWISDGNISFTSAHEGFGIRLNAKFTKDYFINQKYGGQVQFANPK